MNAYEYLQALRAALSALPDDEIDSAMRYYEDYFLDAGDENAAQVIEQLGPRRSRWHRPSCASTPALRAAVPPRFEEDKARAGGGRPARPGRQAGQDAQKGHQSLAAGLHRAGSP